MFEHSFEWANALAYIGFNAVLKFHPKLRPLDLIAEEPGRHTLVGSIARLIDNQTSPPRVTMGLCALPSVGAKLVSIAAGKTLLDHFVSCTIGDFPAIPEFKEAHEMWIEASDLTEDQVSASDVQNYLKHGASRPENTTFSRFVLRGAALSLIVTTLKAGKLTFYLVDSSGKQMRFSIRHLREMLAPETEIVHGENEVDLIANRPVLIGVRCLRAKATGSGYSLEMSQEGHFDAQIWPSAVLPPLRSWQAAVEHTGKPRQRESRYCEYVVLPDRGVRVDPETEPGVANFFMHIDEFVGKGSLPIPEHPDLRMWVLHSISPYEPKRVRMLPESAAAVNALHLGLRLEPVLQYGRAALPQFQPNAIVGARLLSCRVVCAKSGAAIEGAEVIAFVDWQHRTGARRTTDANGEVHLALGNAPIQIDRLYVEAPPKGFWGSYQTGIMVSQGHQITLQPIDPQIDDGLRAVYGVANLSRGKGVKVAVIDGGVGPHKDLTVAGGKNVLANEPPGDYTDWGDGHGTHVAGIIAGNGSPRGVAPGVELYSYRIYGANGESPDSYLIIHALIKAGEQGCDVVNLSFGMEQSKLPHDETLRRAIVDARDRGCVIVAAAGNSGKSPVTLLAKYVSDEGLAVSAIGRRGTYPPGSLQESDIDGGLYGSDPDDFFAAFSSYGLDEVSLTAPGVGIVSTVLNDGYRPLSGTSMAAPAIAGFVARVIEDNFHALSAVHDRKRVTEILNRVCNAARTLGFSREREGLGMPR